MAKLFEGMYQSEISRSPAESREIIKERRVAQLYESFVTKFSDNLLQMFFYEHDGSGDYSNLKERFGKHSWTEEERETIELFAFFAIRQFVDALDSMDDTYEERHGVSLLSVHDPLRTEMSVGHDVMHFFITYLHKGSLSNEVPNFLSQEHYQTSSQSGDAYGIEAAVEEMETLLFSASHKMHEWALSSRNSAREVSEQDFDEACLEEFLRRFSDYCEADLNLQGTLLMGSFRKKLTPKIEGYIRGILSKEDESASREKNEIPFKAVQFFVQSLEPDLEALRTFYKQSHE